MGKISLLLHFPHIILLRGSYGESFFFEDHMGKESEDHMGTVEMEDYMGKGPCLCQCYGYPDYGAAGRAVRCLA